MSLRGTINNIDLTYTDNDLTVEATVTLGSGESVNEMAHCRLLDINSNEVDAKDMDRIAGAAIGPTTQTWRAEFDDGWENASTGKARVEVRFVSPTTFMEETIDEYEEE